MTGADPEKTLRSVVTACADCDTCRFLMDESCLLFPELYRLYDREKEGNEPVAGQRLRRMADLCTLCGLCPCPDIRADVIRGKTERVDQEGMPLAGRLLADVQRFGQWGRLAPKLVNRLLAYPALFRLAAKLTGIHPRRRLPRLADESFFDWAAKSGLSGKPHGTSKAAYFAGCTAGYFFPAVARAAVAVLQHNDVAVQVPPQQCCGMPTLVEGGAADTCQRAAFNLDVLWQVAQAGCDIVCSCPTCGFLFKILLSEKACYAPGYQRSIHAGADQILVPGRPDGKPGHIRLKKSMYDQILKDDGYFAALDPLKRMALSQKVLDMGEYLDRLHREKALKTDFRRLNGRMVYYAPCHQREQAIGTPYLELLTQIPGLTIRPVGGAMDCCGMGGSLGFKKTFHDAAIQLGKPLMKKIAAAEPQGIVTDCLSCRLQFQHLLPYPVYHPLEILAQAYK